MKLVLRYLGDPSTVKPTTINHVEYVRLISTTSIEVKCFGNGSVIHRNVDCFTILYNME